jgi:hypothetical protein
MSEATGIQIQRLILHTVDRREHEEALVSELESPLADPEVQRFLAAHIQSSLAHRYARTARFLPAQGPQPSCQALCDALLAAPGQFVPGSQALARRLFAAMDRRVSPGNLVVCTFRPEGGPPWLALLKMDPEMGIVGERTEIDGKACVLLHRVPNVLPRGQLQKCAFVLPAALRPAAGYDLRVLDQQIDRFGAWRMVASFFSGSFLQCEVGLEPEDVTRAFYYASYAWLLEQVGWPAHDRQRALERVKEALQGQVVDATAIAQEVVPAAQQEEYLAQLQARGVKDLAFEPDPQERERLLRYTWFEGDYGLRVRIESPAVGPGQALSWQTDPQTRVTTVTIQTTRWLEKAH